MKKINKSIISLLTLISLGVNTGFAAWFPSEPMVVYWSVEWTNIENRILKIYDGEDSLLKTIDLIDWKFGTNKTFDLENKITFNKYNWELKFFIDDYALQILDNNSNDCDWNFSFRNWGLCELNFKDVNLKIDTIDDLDNIPEEVKSEEFNDIFTWKVIEKTKAEIKNNIWENIITRANNTGAIVVTNKAVDVDSSVKRDLVLISNTQKELVFIPKDTNTWNNNLVIQKPIKIESTSNIKSQINKDIFWAIEIPTNKQVNFDKDIRVCLDVNINSLSGLKVYASHDNISWFLDSSAKNLVINNSQICFDVNHLTSFAVTKDIPTISSSWGGWGWWNYKPYCKESELVCKNIGGKNYMRAYDIYKCREKNLNQECDIDTNIDSISKLGKITAWTISNTEINNYKLTSKKYISWVRAFIANKREVKQKYGLQVSYVKSDDDYNKTIDSLLKDISSSMKILSIKQDMVKYIDTMSTSYAVSNDETVDDDLRETFKVKLENDIARVKQKLKVLKRKDYIVNKALTERKLRRAEENK